MGNASPYSSLNLVVAWLPGLARQWSLAADARTLLPSLLYGDRVTLICPESDDMMEMSDFSDLYDAFDGGSARGYDDVLDLVSMEAGNADGTPIFPEIWDGLAAGYAEAARDALAVGDRSGALTQLRRIYGLAYGAFDFDAAAHIKDLVPGADARLIGEADHLDDEVMTRGVEPDKVAAALTMYASQPGCYSIVDDPERLLSAANRSEVSATLDRWAKSRSIEAALGADVIRRIPTPVLEQQPWAAVAELRCTLAGPLQRFRVAMARLAEPGAVDPFSEADIQGFTENIFRTAIDPALMELHELTREASLRAVFACDLATDPYAYVGPGLALVAAYGAAVPALIAAAAGATTPIARTLSHLRERRQIRHTHDYLFLQTLQDQTRRH